MRRDTPADTVDAVSRLARWGCILADALVIRDIKRVRQKAQGRNYSVCEISV